MLFTQRIERITEVALATPYVSDEASSRPVNFLFVTLSGGGKSALLLEKFGKVKGVKACGDITYDRLAKDCLDKIHRKEIRTLMFPEFNKVIGRKVSVARNTIGVLDEICEEGVPSIDLPFFQRTWNPPVRCNVIIGMTPSFLNAHLLDWWGYGFAQRFLVVTWNYSDEQVRNVLAYIKKQRHLRERSYSKSFRETKVTLPEKFADKIEAYSMKFCEDMTDYVEKLTVSHGWRFDSKLEKELPYRTQMRLQKFLKAIALVNGRNVVKPLDFLEFKHLFEFMNLRFNELQD